MGIEIRYLEEGDVFEAEKVKWIVSKRYSDGSAWCRAVDIPEPRPDNFKSVRLIDADRTVKVLPNSKNNQGVPISKALFTSNKSEWETPRDLFDRLNAEFNFTLDVCATPANAKVENYFTKEQDGLSQPWKGCIWCNPPYGREVGEWVKRARLASESGDATVVMLLPARTDTKWFHEHILGRAEIRFLKGRLKFSNSINSAPFPSMVVVFREREMQING